MSGDAQKNGDAVQQDEERARAIDDAQTEHDRVLDLTVSASEHLRRATKDLAEIRRVERLVSRR